MTRVGAVAVVLSGVCGACESSAPASSRPLAPRLSATDWGGAVGCPGLGCAATSDAGAGLSPEPVADPPSPARAAASRAAGAWVLHVGDSFVEAWFAQNLGPRFVAEGARQIVASKTSTFTTSWAHDEDLDDWLARRPALVLVTLGANEVDIPSPAYHAGAVQAIARKIGAVAPCVWIAPPLWKPDRPGWLQVIHDHCAPCLFFDSDAVLGDGGLARDERRGDGIHPNQRGGARWARAFWGWLEDHRDEEKGPWALEPFERRAD